MRLSVRLDHILAVLVKYSPSSLSRTADSDVEIGPGGGVGGEGEDILRRCVADSRC